MRFFCGFIIPPRHKPGQGQEEEEKLKKEQEWGSPPALSVYFCYVIANCGLWSLNNMTCTSSIKGC